MGTYLTQVDVEMVLVHYPHHHRSERHFFVVQMIKMHHISTKESIIIILYSSLESRVPGVILEAPCCEANRVILLIGAFSFQSHVREPWFMQALQLCMSSFKRSTPTLESPDVEFSTRSSSCSYSFLLAITSLARSLPPPHPPPYCSCPCYSVLFFSSQSYYCNPRSFHPRSSHVACDLSS